MATTTTTTPFPVRLEADLDIFLFGLTNMRPLSSITLQRVVALAEQIQAAQHRCAGYFGTGIERPVIVYENGADGLHVEDGQERILAVRHLLQHGAMYDYIGIPVEIRPEPMSIWESTRFQIALHDVDPVNLIDLVRRAVELKESPAPNGKKATWEMVAQVMGKKDTTWVHYQHLLDLIPELQEAVNDGRCSGQVGAYIGKDLPKELQAEYLGNLLDVCKSLYATKSLIRQILDYQDVAEVLERTDGDDPVEMPDGDDEAADDYVDLEDQEPAKVDPEAAFVLRRAKQSAARLMELAEEGRLTGTKADIKALRGIYEELELSA